MATNKAASEIFGYEEEELRGKPLIANTAKKRLSEILERNSYISIEFMNFPSTNLSEIKAQLLKMSYGSLRKKTSNTRLYFTKTLPKKQEGAIAVTRYDLANVAGIAKESLIRTLSNFKMKE